MANDGDRQHEVCNTFILRSSSVKIVLFKSVYAMTLHCEVFKAETFA